MTNLAQIQAQFSASIITGDDALIAGAIKTGRVPMDASLTIYRNNIASSMTRALCDLFPVIVKLVGEEFFAALAREYITLAPPDHGRLNDYGRTFPEFLKSFPPVASMPYLCDVAALELAWNDAFHAADTTALAPDDLSAIPEDSFPNLCFEFHPSARLLRSPHPIGKIWRVNQDDADPDQTVDLASGPDHLLVLRASRDVEIHCLSPGEWAFLSALASSTTLKQAHDEALATASDFDLEATLIRLMSVGLLVTYSIPSAETNNA